MLKQGRYISPDTHATRFDARNSQRPMALLIIAIVLAVAIGGAWLYFQTNEYGTGEVEDTGSFPSSMEGVERE